MRIQIHGDAARLAQHFTIGVDPERDRAADLYPLSFISKQTFKAHMIPVISGREDPEEIQAVQVIGTEQIQFSVCIDSVRTELESAAFVTCIHDNCKECAGLHICISVTGDLHSDHRACQYHMDSFRDVDQLSHTDLVEEDLEPGIVSLLAYSSIKSDAGADVKESDAAGIVVFPFCGTIV